MKSIHMLLVFIATSLNIFGGTASAATKFEVDEFELKYIDKSNNLAWSRILPFTYSNGCIGIGRVGRDECTYRSVPGGGQEVLLDSKAAQACHRIGARLPTKKEYESLIRNFDHKDSIDGPNNRGPRLTDKGISEMKVAFDDMANYEERFWSSSVNSNLYYTAASAWVFSLRDIQSVVSREALLRVRCVVEQ